MKKIILVFLFLIVPTLAFSETITWTNPTEYTDGSPISSQDQAALKTHIYWGTSANGPWTEFALVENGANTWSGKLPAARGQLAYYTLKSELHNLLSDYCTPVSYTVPFIPTKSPVGLTISP